MAEKQAHPLERVIVICLAGVILTPLVTIHSLPFPFITGKHIYFRALVEAALAAWLLLLIRRPDLRPRPSAIWWAGTAFLVATSLSTLTGVSPLRSFWSDGERMEGLATYLHLAAFFAAMSTLFEKPGRANRFLSLSLLVSLAVSLQALMEYAGILPGYHMEGRIAGSLGNPSFLAAYLLFHIGIAAWLWSVASPAWPERQLYGGAIVLELIVLCLTQSRGAFIGLIAGAVIFACTAAVLHKRTPRRIALTLLTAIAFCGAAFIALHRTAIVRENALLKRLSDISLADPTTASRIILWKIGIEGWRERPVFGWGPENYIVAANKYFDPSLWRQDWYDRAHNVLVDRVVMSGIVGLAAWLALYAAALWMLHGARRSRFTSMERSVVTSLIAAYFVQSLFSLDDLVSYICFAIVLGGIHGKTADDITSPRENITENKMLLRVGGIVITGGFVVSSYLFVFRYADSAVALRASARAATIDDACAEFERALAPNSPLSVIAIKQLLDIAAPSVTDSTIPITTRRRLDALARTGAEREIDRTNRTDANLILLYAKFLAQTGDTVFAESLFAEARQLSPRKQLIIFQQAFLCANTGRHAEALSLAREAYELNPHNPEAERVLAHMQNTLPK